MDEFKSYQPDIAIHITNKLYKGVEKLQYNEEKHKYFLDNIELTSVTKIVSNLKDNDFEAVKISNITAKKHNETHDILNTEYALSNQYFLDRWKYNSEFRMALGTYVHLFTQSFPFFTKYELKEEEMVIDYFKNIPSKYIHVCSEFKMYNTEFKFAGTTDMLLYDVEDNSFIICDWKTNSKLDEKNSGYCKIPFSFYKNSKVNGYNIQLIYYKYAFEQMFKNVECYIPLSLLNNYNIDYAYVVEDNKTGISYYKVRFKISDLQLIWLSSLNPTYKIIELDNIDLKSVYNNDVKITKSKNKK